MTTVVVTGVGATTPLGGTATDTWAAALAGTPGIHTLPFDWIDTLPVHFAGKAMLEPTDQGLEPVKARRLDRSQQFAIVAAREAWANAGLGDDVDTERLGVSFATGIGGIISVLQNYETLLAKGWNRVPVLAVPQLMPNGPAAWVGLEFGAKAGVHCPVSACASGAEAVVVGAKMIMDGRADVVVVGGTEAALHPMPMASFAVMRALSTRNDSPETASRPYDKHRDGFVMAEGAAALVLESEEHARARGARIYAAYAGAGLTSDGHDIAQPEPEGRGAGRAVQQALRDSGLSPADIAHVNAHATSTPAGDVAEAKAIRLGLGSHADRVLVSATKSMTGHMLGGAGAIESVFSVLALHHRIAPPTINITDIEDGLGIDVVRDTARPLPAGDIAAINNSFGFGGHDVAVVFRTL